LADVFLQFGGDLRVVPPRVPLTVKKGVKSGSTVTTASTVQFVNDGPSAALEGSVTISVGGPGQSVIPEAGLNVSAPFSNCKSEDGILNCEFHNFLAHQRGTIQLLAATKVNI